MNELRSEGSSEIESELRSEGGSEIVSEAGSAQNY